MEEVYYTLEELHEIVGTDTHFIIELVEYGVLHPKVSESKKMKFSTEQLPKLRRAIRMQQDLELNIAGIALALDLLDELETMRSQIKQLEHELSLLHIDYK